jgi:hypothetical protein
MAAQTHTRLTPSSTKSRHAKSRLNAFEALGLPDASLLSVLQHDAQTHFAVKLSGLTCDGIGKAHALSQQLQRVAEVFIRIRPTQHGWVKLVTL